MRVIAEMRLKEFWTRHPEAETRLRSWLTAFRHCHAHDYIELKQTFNSADYVPDKYTVFNVGGNDYRIVLVIHYNTQQAYVRLVATHAEYDKWTRKNRA